MLYSIFVLLIIVTVSLLVNILSIHNLLFISDDSDVNNNLYMILDRLQN